MTAAAAQMGKLHPNAALLPPTESSVAVASSSSLSPGKEINGDGPQQGHNAACSSSSSSTSWQKEEAKLLLHLAFPTIVIQIGAVLPSFLVASQVGLQFGPEYLSGFTLANMMGNLCNLSLLQGLFTAADTLAPQAYTFGNYAQVGLLSIRGFIASMAFVVIPINALLVVYFERILTFVGEDPDAARHAHLWYQVYALALPCYALYNVTWKFLSSQEIMRPLMVVSLIGCAIVLPTCMVLYNRWFGFVGTALTVVSFMASQAIFLILYLRWFRPHTAGTWPGLSWKTIREACEWKEFRLYLWLGLGGMLATSEWIYWESLTLLIGTMGVVPLSVHTIPTQVIMFSFMFPMGTGIALAVRLGAILPRNVHRAKQLAAGTFIASVVIFGIMGIFLFVFQDSIFHIFTNDDEVLHGARSIWPKVCIYYFCLSIYGINMGISTGLGQQWMFGIVTFIFLWGISLPSMYYFCIMHGGGIDVAWACIYQPYIGMNLYFLYRFSCATNWKAIQKEIRLREGTDGEIMEDKEEEMGRLALLSHDDESSQIAQRVPGQLQDGLNTNGMSETTGLLHVENGTSTVFNKYQ